MGSPRNPLHCNPRRRTKPTPARYLDTEIEQESHSGKEHAGLGRQVEAKELEWCTVRRQPRKQQRRARDIFLGNVSLGELTAAIGETELIIILPLLYPRLSNLGAWKLCLAVEKNKGGG